MTKSELNYVAGLLEGEGWFGVTFYKSQGSPFFHIGAQMVDKEPLEKLAKILGGPIYGPYQTNPKWKPIYRWQIGRAANSLQIMQKLHPLLSPRRQKRIEEILMTAVAWPSRKPKKQ